jgi:hypothetical protein
MNTLRTPCIDAEHALLDVEEIFNTLLQVYYAQDSEADERQTVSDLRHVELTLRTMDEYLASGLEVAFTTGDQPITGMVLGDNGYGEETQAEHSIEPHTDITFARVVDRLEEKGTLVGGELLVSLPTLAGTLALNGSIHLIDLNESIPPMSLNE